MYESEEKLWWYRGLRSLIAHYLKRYASSDSVILDAGCGTGKNIEFLQSLEYRSVEGFDHSPDAVAFCKKRGLDQVKAGSITEIGYPDASFNIVLCMDVLGALEEVDRIKAVAELMRVLKPGGLLLANTAALELFRSPHDEVVNQKIRFNKEQFAMLFVRYDVEILKLSYRVFLLSPLVTVFKFAKRVFQSARQKAEPQTDQVVFPLGVNWLLFQIQLLDNRLFRRFNLPLGTSLFLVLRKC